MGTYFISDTHFNHQNIIEYCNRPFKDVEEMNNTIINRWNNVVKKDDIVYHLGDVALSSESLIKEIIPKLNGKKILIRGNHDTKSITFFESTGFTVLRNPPIILEKERLILSHVPLPDTMIPKGYTNIHGHIHNHKLNESVTKNGNKEYPKELYSEEKHINISADVINFTPIPLEEIINMIKA